MGIYDKVSKRLPPAPLDDPVYQAKLDAFKNAISENTTHTPESLAILYRQARVGDIEFNGVDAVEEIATAMDQEQLENLIVDLFGKEGLKRLLYRANIRVEALTQMLINSHDGDEPGWGNYGAKPNTIRYADGFSVSIHEDPYVKVEDREAFRKWCLENGFESQMTLHPQTAAGVIKAHLRDGRPEPDGCKAFRHREIQFRKPRGHNSEGVEESDE